MKILILSIDYPPNQLGGVGTHVFELATGLVGRGFRVSVLTPTLQASSATNESGISVHRITTNGNCYESARTSVAKAVQAVNSRVMLYGRNLFCVPQERPDIIHCHDWHSFYAAERLGKMFNIPVVGSIHFVHTEVPLWWGDAIPKETARLEETFCRQADALIAVSRSVRDLIISIHKLTDGEDRIHVVNNGFDATGFTRSALATEEISQFRQLYASAGEKIALYVGRIYPQKGIDALLASAAEVITHNPLVRYLIVGGHEGSGDAAEITRMVKEVYPQYGSLWSNLQFLGKVPREHIIRFYQIADLALVPSIYEPFGYSAIEAMAAGVPLVSTRVGGLADVIIHGKTGLLVSVHPCADGLHRVDIKQLAEAQLELLGDRERCMRMGKAGQQRVLDEYTLEKMTQSIVSVYRQVLAKAAGARNK
jgi:alpha-maltose-1-phosphate synthase